MLGKANVSNVFFDKTTLVNLLELLLLCILLEYRNMLSAVYITLKGQMRNVQNKKQHKTLQVSPQSHQAQIFNIRFLWTAHLNTYMANQEMRTVICMKMCIGYCLASSL